METEKNRVLQNGGWNFPEPNEHEIVPPLVDKIETPRFVDARKR